ncbi:glycosyltransferase family 2 protein [Mumia sp. zg.B17]|nr:glycosyltransferase family 2 protein [Mumia sp. zg.B17]
MMVRDEADIVAAMVEHHLAQGVDLIIATDNASVDGTREILSEYAAHGVVELHDDPRHAKQQSEVVTAMARRAYEVHDATWVLNADADEFWLPVDRSLSLRDAFERIPPSLGAFAVPVTNLTGTPARRGPGLRRLVWRDERDAADLMDLAGLHAQPTPNAVHVGSSDVTVAQGNHFVSIPSNGAPDEAFRLEVLHLPWRSLDQHRAKVEMSGRAYEASPTLRPSPNHHGMRDYRRLQAGFVEEFYLYRHPVDPQGDPAFSRDTSLLEALSGVLADGRAIVPSRLEQALDDVSDEEFGPDEVKASAQVARIIIPLERVHLAVSERARDDLRASEARAKKAAAAAAQREKELKKRLRATKQNLAQARSELAAVRESRSYRVARAVARPLQRLRRR